VTAPAGESGLRPLLGQQDHGWGSVLRRHECDRREGPVHLSIIKGSLPPGVTLNSSTGHLGGTPATAGTYTFTSKVVDANGSSDTDTCTIVVQPKGW